MTISHGWPLDACYVPHLLAWESTRNGQVCICLSSLWLSRFTIYQRKPLSCSLWSPRLPSPKLRNVAFHELILYSHSVFCNCLCIDGNLHNLKFKSTVFLILKNSDIFGFIVPTRRCLTKSSQEPNISNTESYFTIRQDRLMVPCPYVCPILVTVKPTDDRFSWNSQHHATCYYNPHITHNSLNFVPTCYPC